MNNFNDTPPISPVSTSPYIPIFECITGKSPIFDPKVGYKNIQFLLKQKAYSKFNKNSQNQFMSFQRKSFLSKTFTN